MLDLNELRAEFARQLLDDHGRFSFDRALYKVLLVAYQAGIEEDKGAGIDGDAEFGRLIRYPEHWDTAAYPTLSDAVREKLAWAGCSECKPEATFSHALEKTRLSDDNIVWMLDKAMARQYGAVAGKEQVAINIVRAVEEYYGLFKS